MAWEILEEAPSAGIGKKSHQPQSEGLLGALTRAPVRAAEAAIGLPGDILQGAGNLLTAAGRYIDPTILGQAPAFKSPLPTTEQARSATRAITGGSLEPSTEAGKTSDEFVQDVVQWLIPGGTLKKAAGIAGLGGLAKWGSKKLGLDEETGDIIKLGTQLGASLFDVPTLESYLTKQYDKAKQVPEAIRVAAPGLKDSVTRLRHEVNNFRGFPDKDKFIEGILDPLTKNIDQGKVSFNRITRLRKDFNQWWNKLDSSGRELLHDVQGKLKDVIENGYKSVNDTAVRPLVQEAGQGIVKGNELLSAIQRNEEVEKWASKTLSKLGKVPYVGKPFKLASYFPKGLSGLELIRSNKAAQEAAADLFKAYASKNVPLLKKTVDKLGKLSAQEQQPSSSVGNWEILE